MPRPSLISQIHELKYELRRSRLKTSDIPALQTRLETLLTEACAEYKCSKGEFLRTIASDFGAWVREERLPHIAKDLPLSESEKDEG